MVSILIFMIYIDEECFENVHLCRWGSLHMVSSRVCTRSLFCFCPIYIRFGSLLHLILLGIRFFHLMFLPREVLIYPFFGAVSVPCLSCISFVHIHCLSNIFVCLSLFHFNLQKECFKMFTYADGGPHTPCPDACEPSHMNLNRNFWHTVFLLFIIETF